VGTIIRPKELLAHRLAEPVAVTAAVIMMLPSSIGTADAQI
jgi:hypothetical protein